MKIKPANKPGRVTFELNRRDDRLLAKAAENGASPFKLKQILVPVDFSGPSQKALQYALPLAKKFGAKITLLHVVEPVIYPESVVVPPELEEMNLHLMKDSRERLELLRRTTVDPAISSKPKVLLGKPWQEIVNAARSIPADLIIVATHGYTGLKHFFIGSTAERVVRHAPCPVLTVREREHDFV
jgi:nucleotide-binding universal stress UspA family protein